MTRFSRPIALLAFSLCTSATFAQAPSWLEETMFRSGKINVVVAVVAVILIGLVVWMFAMDRKVKRMEERMKNQRMDALSDQ